MIRSVDQPREIDWCVGVDGVDGVYGVRRQDGGIAPPEGVGFRMGEIVLIAVRWRDEARGSGCGCHGGW